MSKLKFSLLISNFNYAHFVAKAIESCLAQDYPVELFEIIVVDDGSTDQSAAVLEKFKANAQIKILHQANLGQAAATHLAFEQSSGEYICLLDADDRFSPNKLKAISEKLEKYRNLPEDFFLCHDLEVQFENSAKRLSWFEAIGVHSSDALHLPLANSHFPFAPTSGQIYSRKLMQKILSSLTLSDWRLNFDTVLAHAALMTAGSVHYLYEKLGTYRIHAGNEFAAFTEEGKFFPKNKTRYHWPKLLKFLEAYLDSSEEGFEERNEKLAYLKRLEKELRLSPENIAYVMPKVSFVVLKKNQKSSLEQTLASIEEQAWPNSQIVLSESESSGSELKLLAEAYFKAEGDFLVFADENTIFDKHFVERHIYHHQYKALCTISSSDVRILNWANALVFSGLYTEHLWKSNLEYKPPFKFRLNSFMQGLLQASCLRKTKLMDLFFEAVLQIELPPSLAIAYDWLIVNYACHLGGHLLINECFSSVVLEGAIDGLQFSHDLNNALLCRDLQSAELKAFFGYLIEKNVSLFKAYCTTSGINSLQEWLNQNLQLHTAQLFEKHK